MNIEAYEHIRNGGFGIYEMQRGLVAVHGKEAVQFLDGLISNDMKTLEDGAQMLAAFPNAKGRLLAVVRVLRDGERFLFDTESATHKALFDNLFRFTYAGDFFVEDLSEGRRYFELIGMHEPAIGLEAEKLTAFRSAFGIGYFASNDIADSFRADMIDAGAAEIDHELFETIRIEHGVPKYGVDMDEATVVPELGIDGLISYTKGCYIGQEIIARIHFRGHVAKQMTGLVLGGDADNVLAGDEITDGEGKPAGKITSAVYSPILKSSIALASVRYAFLEDGTELTVNGTAATVKALPFV